jgi:protein involved in polysaccharide export with SLBB domain
MTHTKSPRPGAPPSHRPALSARVRVAPVPGSFRRPAARPARIPLVGRFALILTGVILLFLSGRVETNATQFNTEYKLGAMDQVRLKVFEWRAAKDEVFEWAALNAEYAIGPSGRISLPLIGEVAAAGLTVNDLAKSIGQRLQSRMGLNDAPDIAVEVSKFRPFYLVGAVEKPGEYAYRPGMTVLQALAVAGGVTRTGDNGGRIEREVIQARGDIEMFTYEFNSLLARRARLDAEVKGGDQPLFPAALLQKASTVDSVGTLLRQEDNIFRSRRELFDNQVATLEQLTRYLQAQSKSLEEQIKNHEDQMALVQKELDGVASLVKKGYSTESRKLGLERNATQLQGDRLRLQDGLLRVNGELSRTNIALLDLHSKRITEATADLRDVQSKLEAIAHRSDVAEQLLYESEAIAPMLIAERVRAGKRLPVYSIVRAIGGEVSATEQTQIEPGDTIKVEMPRAELGLRPMLVGSDGDEQAPARRLNPAFDAALPQGPVSRPGRIDAARPRLVPSSAQVR